MNRTRPRQCSFDVFDTCLVRDLASGVDLLAAAARAVVPAGPDADEVVGEAVRLRLAGEQRARADGRDATSLSEIYAAIPELLRLGVDPDEMHAVEVRLECASLRPVAPVARRIEDLHASGEHVVFISDMHLDPVVIWDLLSAYGMAQDGDVLFVSGDVGRSKLTGRLYDHVLEELGLAPHELEHTGDDEWVDGRMAAGRGIVTVPFTDGRLNRYERLVASAPAVPALARSRAAGISRLARLGEADDQVSAGLAAAIGADVVGPLFTGFVRWLLDDAGRRGVQDLCFVARDGQVLHELAQRIRRAGDPAIHYVHGSRQAWFPAGVRTGALEELSWVVDPPHEPASVRSVLAKLDITAEQARPHLVDTGLTAEDRVVGSTPALQGLLRSLRPLIAERAGTSRDLLVRYLRDKGVLDGAPWAVVDVGWYLNGQAALRRALGAELAPGGYYLGARYGRRSLMETGWFRALVREDHPEGRGVLQGGWVLDNLNLVEHVMAKADHGGCLGYEEVEGTVVPRLAPARPLPTWFTPLRAAALRYATAAEGAGLLDDGGAAAFAAGDAAGRLFAKQPSRGEARLFGATLVSDDQNETQLRRLAEPYRWDDLRWRVVRKLRRLDDDPFR